MSASDDTAMLLFSKYNEIGYQIKTAHENCVNLQETFDKLKDEEQQLIAEEKNAKATTAAALNSTKKLELQLKNAEQDYFEAKQHLSSASLAAERAKRELETAKTTIAMQRQEFLNESQVFQQSCKRLRLTASVLGLYHAHQQAAATVHGISDPAVFDNLDSKAKVDNDMLDDEPTNWTIADSDKELKDALALFVTEKAKLEALEADLRARMKKKQELEARESKTVDQSGQLQTQLDRIERDNIKLERQIQEMNRLAVEASQKEERFASQIRDKQMKSYRRDARVTPSPALILGRNGQPTSRPIVASNPYAKNLSSVPNSAARRRKDIQQAVLGIGRATEPLPTLEESTCLGAQDTFGLEAFLVNDDSCDDDDGILSFVAFPTAK